jgi:trk system potassium uptake protein TrkH
VNFGIVAKMLGNLLVLEAAGMVLPFLVSIYYNQHDKKAFIICIALTGLVGFILTRTPNKKKAIKIKEAVAIVSLGWIAISVFGSLPFIFSESINSFVDAFFETVSGFTTTGATLVDNVEALPKGILFWRSFTHWIGGMGILVFTVAILPALGVGSFQIFKAESPGPVAERIVPRIKDTAKILYTTYIAITIVEIVLLRFGGMSLFESTVHTFGSVGTGGFSTRNASIGAYDSTYIHMIIAVFMMLSGVNFSLYYALIKGKWRDAVKDQELRFYLGVIGASTILIALNININLYNNIWESLKYAYFQVSSIITTTGYATTNFDQWTTFSKGILFLLMFIGGCAGSTAGGIKGIRVLVLLKMIKRQILKMFHPRAVIPVKVGQRTLSTDVLNGISSFFILYIVVFEAYKKFWIG